MNCHRRFFVIVRIQKTVWLLVAGCLLVGEGLAQDSQDRFELFNYCYPMSLVVEGLPSGAAEINLTDESIQAALESRLRSARLYDSEGIDWLYIGVNVVGAAFSIELKFFKRVHDVDSDETGSAATWDIASTGTHGGDAGYILSSISMYMDRFLVEFLRVNEEACEQR